MSRPDVFDAAAASIFLNRAARWEPVVIEIESGWHARNIGGQSDGANASRPDHPARPPRVRMIRPAGGQFAWPGLLSARADVAAAFSSPKQGAI